MGSVSLSEFTPRNPPVGGCSGAQSSLAGVALIAGIFGLVTIGTMMGVVALAHSGIQRLPLPEGSIWLGHLERYAHALRRGGDTQCRG